MSKTAANSAKAAPKGAAKAGRTLFRVTFAVRDCYLIDLEARSLAEAIEKAQDLYDREGEAPFTFDISDGGTFNWDAERLPTAAEKSSPE